jgi:hypothetical protein
MSNEPRLEPVEFLNSIKKKILNKLPFADLGNVEVVVTVGISNMCYGDSLKIRVPKYHWSECIGYEQLNEQSAQRYADDLCRVWVAESIPSEFADCLKRE